MFLVQPLKTSTGSNKHTGVDAVEKCQKLCKDHPFCDLIQYSVWYKNCYLKSLLSMAKTQVIKIMKVTISDPKNKMFPFLFFSRQMCFLQRGIAT